MAMTAEHKAALAEGRAQARAIKAYLEALSNRRPGRPVTKDSLTKKVASLEAKIDNEADPLKRVELVQQRLDAERQLSTIGEGADFAKLEEDFVRYAPAYSDRKGISYSAWRESGISADVLRRAGIARTRKTT